MLTPDEARDMARDWRPRFADEQAFEQSWSRFFDMVGDPTRQKLEGWLAKDMAKDELRRVAVVKEPLLPTRSRHQFSDCYHCGGLRYVMHRGDDITIDHPDFGKAFPCPDCWRR